MKKIFLIEHFDTGMIVDKDILESCLFSDAQLYHVKDLIITDITERQGEEIIKKIWKVDEPSSIGRQSTSRIGIE